MPALLAAHEDDLNPAARLGLLAVAMKLPTPCLTPIQDLIVTDEAIAMVKKMMRVLAIGGPLKIDLQRVDAPPRTTRAPWSPACTPSTSTGSS